MMKLKYLIGLCLIFMLANLYAQTLPYTVVNPTTGDMNIRSGTACATAPLATTLAFNGKLVASSITTGSCGLDWYQIDIPLTTAPTTSYYAAIGSGYLVADPTTPYVQVYNTGSTGLHVRTAPGGSLVTIGSANAQVWDGQKYATTGTTQLYNGYTWYQIYLTKNTSQTTGLGWVGSGDASGQYLTYHAGQSVQTYGSVNVTLNPSGAVSAGAQWNIDGGGWQTSGTTLGTISPGSHTINFNTITGWTSPSSQSITVSANTTTSPSGTYSVIQQYGSVNVTLNPSGAVSAGAQWNIDGGGWQTSGTTLGTISPGSHTINFNTITGWTSPSSQSITVSANTTTSPSGTYVLISIPLPDLSIQVQANPVTVTNLVPTSSTQLTYTLKNAGNGVAGVSTTSFFLSSDNVYNPTIDTKLKDTIEPSLTATTGSWTHTVTVTIPSGTSAATWYILIISDAPNNINESNESNNSNFVPVSVGATLPYITDDYPYRPYTGQTDSCNSKNYNVPDAWGSFIKFQCVSYVAWKVNQFHGITDINLPESQYWFQNHKWGTADPSPACTPINIDSRLSNACNWDDVLVRHYKVNKIPAVGAIAHWNANVNGVSSAGHVAFVNYVSGNTVIYTNYNYVDNNNNLTPCQFGYHQIDVSKPFSARLSASPNLIPEEYIHVEVDGGGGGTDIARETFNSSFLGNRFMNIFPNPNSGQFVLGLDGTQDKQVQIRIINLAGKEVYKSQIDKSGNGYSQEIDLPNVSKGIYFLSVKIGDRIQTEKLVISK